MKIWVCNAAPLCAILIAGAPTPLNAQANSAEAQMPAILTDPAVMRDYPLPDYSYAGYGFGLEAIPSDPGTIINVTDHGVVPDDGNDDAKAVLKALAAADTVTGRVTIRFPKGRIQIGEVIPITRSEIILDGAGEGQGGTELYFPRPLKIVDKSGNQDELREYLKREDKYQREPDQNIDALFTEYSWSGGFLFIGPKGTRPVSYDGEKDKRDPVLTVASKGKQFDRVLQVENAKALKVGQVVQLQWFSGDGADSAILKSLYGDVSKWNAAQTEKSLELNIGSHHWTFPNRPVVGQSTRIRAIKGNNITLGDPLLHNVSANQPAVVAQWDHLTQVGVQNMRLAFPDNPWFGHHLEQGYNGIYMTGLFDGWAKNLVIHNADSGILTDNAASLTIANITTTGEHKAHYSVHIGAVHNVLVKDLRVENPVIHPVSVNTRSSRSVYQRAVVLRDAILDQHSGSNHQNLFDQLTLHIKPKMLGAGRWTYRLWEGGGASYWKPGHGLMNTVWNARLQIGEGPAADDRVKITSGLEGPGARIIRLYGNRPLDISYTPTAYIEDTNDIATSVPSLYDYQLAKRKKK
ncbi:MAG: hypothetical protein HC843_09310 [Sphingomonadales bacterium]|nr:hypothetical protein [Sphingomonadales bacterium]